MKPATIDWVTFNNEDWSFALRVEFSDATPFDWSQYSAIKLQLKADPLQPEPEFELSLDAGITVRSNDHAAIDCFIAESAIDDLIGSYVYDVIGTHGGSDTPVVRGTIIVLQGITR